MGRLEFENFFFAVPDFSAPTPGLAHRAYWTKPGVSVDLCCGQGKNLPPLARHSGKVIAVDLSDLALREAKQRLRLENGRVPKHVQFWQDDARKLFVPTHDFLVYAGNLFLAKPNRIGKTLGRLQAPARPGAVHFLTAYAEGAWAPHATPRTYALAESETVQARPLHEVVRTVEQAYVGWNLLRMRTRIVRVPVMRDGRNYFWKGKEVIFEFRKPKDEKVTKTRPA